MLLSYCVFLDSLLRVVELVSKPQPPHGSGHGCTVGFDRDGEPSECQLLLACLLVWWLLLS